MSLADELKARVTTAVKSGDALTRDALRTVLGEAQAEAVRRKGEVTDDVVFGVIKKTVAGLKETIPLVKRADRDTAQQEGELALLESLLPRAWDRDAIAAALAPHRDDLRAAKNDGQAMGVAIKVLKAQGATTTPEDVKAVVSAVRAGPELAPAPAGVSAQSARPANLPHSSATRCPGTSTMCSPDRMSIARTIQTGPDGTYCRIDT